MAGYGIDYGRGTTANRTVVNGEIIHYGVIPMNSLHEWAHEDFTDDFGEPTCPKCGGKCVDSSDAKVEEDFCENCNHQHGYKFVGGKEGTEPDNKCSEEGCSCGDFCELIVHKDYYCEDCHKSYWSDRVFSEEIIGSYIDDEDLKAQSGPDGDVFVLKSPYFTYAQFCSPCAPGACYLLQPVDKNGAKAFCFGHDWFSSGKAPYPVFSVETGKLVKPERKKK